MSRMGQVTLKNDTRSRGWEWRGVAALVLVLAACTTPPMEPLTESALQAAEREWAAHGSDSYKLVVQVRAPRVAPAVYKLVVNGGEIASIARDDGQAVPLDEAHDYSIPGLFRLLRGDLRLADIPDAADVPPIDVRARFDRDTGRLVRYRRTVGTKRRRVLLIEVLQYEPRLERPAADLSRRHAFGGRG